MSLPVRVLLAINRFCWNRVVMFSVIVCLFILWRWAPPYTPSELVEIERERLRVEQQREEYELERLRMLGRVLQMNGRAMERAFQSPANMGREPTTNNTHEPTSQ